MLVGFLFANRSSYQQNQQFFRASLIRNLLLSFLLLPFLLIGVNTAYAAAEPVYTSSTSNNGAGGYDVVSYFTQNKAVKGSKKYVSKWKGADWLFLSAANKQKFDSNPEKYAPQYGGYCAWAVSEGYTAKGDPQQWTVFNNKLYLNYNASVKATWERNKPGNVARGNRNWPDVLKK